VGVTVRSLYQKPVPVKKPDAQYIGVFHKVLDNKEQRSENGITGPDYFRSQKDTFSIGF
jgi:hypothetical protein